MDGWIDGWMDGCDSIVLVRFNTFLRFEIDAMVIQFFLFQCIKSQLFSRTKHLPFVTWKYMLVFFVPFDLADLDIA